MRRAIDEAAGAFVPGQPRELFRFDTAIVPHATLARSFHTYGVSPDGERFVIPLPVSGLNEKGTASAIVVRNCRRWARHESVPARLVRRAAAWRA